MSTENTQSSQDSGTAASTRGAYKFDARAKELYLEILRDGFSKTAAARKVRVNRRTVEKHRQRYPKFDAAVREAELDAADTTDLLRDNLLEIALNPEAKDVDRIKASDLLLKSNDPTWQPERRYRMYGGRGPDEDEGPVQAEVVQETRDVVVIAPTPEHTAAVVRLMNEVGLGLAPEEEED